MSLGVFTNPKLILNCITWFYIIWDGTSNSVILGRMLFATSHHQLNPSPINKYP